MFTVARNFSFSYGHRLYRYEGKCRRLHGHNAEVRVEIGMNELNEQGMALDFVNLKDVVGKWIDDELDHRVFLSKDDPVAHILLEVGEPVLLTDGNPTAELLAKMIFEYVASQGLNVLKVEFWETKNCRATYSK